MPESNEILCPVCSNPIPPKGKTGPRKTYCTTQCRQRANKPSPDDVEKAKARANQRSAEIRANTVKTCPVCAETFTPVKSLAKMYCSDKCLRKATKYSRTRTCSEANCRGAVMARGLCSTHYGRVARNEGIAKQQPWNPRRQRNYQVRMERLNGAKNGDPVMLEKLIARGDKICPECGEEIDLSLEYPDPLYRTIDHKKPLAMGGKHTLSNCQLMHFKCNSVKGVRLSAKA